MGAQTSLEKKRLNAKNIQKLLNFSTFIHEKLFFAIILHSDLNHFYNNSSIRICCTFKSSVGKRAKKYCFFFFTTIHSKLQFCHCFSWNCHSETDKYIFINCQRCLWKSIKGALTLWNSSKWIKQRFQRKSWHLELKRDLQSIV